MLLITNKIYSLAGQIFVDNLEFIINNKHTPPPSSQNKSNTATSPKKKSIIKFPKTQNTPEFRPLNDEETLQVHIAVMLGHLPIPPFSQNFEDFNILNNNASIIDSERTLKIKQYLTEIAPYRKKKTHNYFRTFLK